MPPRPPSTQDPDFICVLRATSRAHGLGALLSRFPRWKPDSWWQAGTPDHHGRVRTHNGFNLFVGEGREWKRLRVPMMRRLRALAPMISLGREFGAHFVLDVGVTPGRREFWYLEARFTPEDQALLAELGVELCVTAYPVAEAAKGTGVSPQKRRAETRRRRRAVRAA
jgi:hypothetical protein